MHGVMITSPSGGRLSTVAGDPPSASATQAGVVAVARRVVRRRLVAATACLIGCLGLVAAMATPAAASSILIITPSSVAPGFAVTISAICGDNANSAFVNSNVFGSITLVPDNGKLATNVTVPSGTKPGTYDVSLTCADGTVTNSKLTVLRHAPP
ncbi:MAG TPA: hypothetical protein VH442_12465, partial [Micromonosporaceae bacterium]